MLVNKKYSNSDSNRHRLIESSLNQQCFLCIYWDHSLWISWHIVFVVVYCTQTIIQTVDTGYRYCCKIYITQSYYYYTIYLLEEGRGRGGRHTYTSKGISFCAPPGHCMQNVVASINSLVFLFSLESKLTRLIYYYVTAN